LLSDVPITSVTLSPTGTRTSNPNTAEKQEEGKEEKIRKLFFFGTAGAKNKGYNLEFTVHEGKLKKRRRNEARIASCRKSKTVHSQHET
jgi:hypothetical protein